MLTDRIDPGSDYMATPTIRRTTSADISPSESGDVQPSHGSDSSFTTETRTSVPTIEHGSVFDWATLMNNSKINITVLFGTAAFGVCCMVAGMLYSSFVKASRTVNARLDYLTESNRVSNQLLHQSIMSLQSSMDHHGQGGGGHDPRAAMTSSNHAFIPGEFHMAEASSSGLFSTIELVLTACAVFIVGLVIHRRFLQHPRPPMQDKPSKPMDAPGSDRSTTTSTQLSPSKNFMGSPDHFGVERKRQRRRSVSFGRTSNIPESTATVPARTTTPPAPAISRPSPGRSPVGTTNASMSPNPILKSPSMTVGPGAFGPKFNKAQGQSAVHTRLVMEDQQLKARKSSPSAQPTPPVVHSHFETFMPQQCQSPPKTPPQEPSPTGSMMMMITPGSRSPAKRAVMSVTRCIFPIGPDPTAGSHLFNDNVSNDDAEWTPPLSTKKESRNAMKARLALEDQELNSKKKSVGSGGSPQKDGHGVTKRSDSKPTKNSPGVKKEDLHVMKARVREEFTTSPQKTSKKKAQSSLNSKSAHESPQQKKMMMSPQSSVPSSNTKKKSADANQMSSSKQHKLDAIRAEVKNNQHLLGR